VALQRCVRHLSYVHESHLRFRRVRGHGQIIGVLAANTPNETAYAPVRGHCVTVLRSEDGDDCLLLDCVSAP
jgi:hypothetical protein